jgi:hypothetical protein
VAQDCLGGFYGFAHLAQQRRIAMPERMPRLSRQLSAVAYDVMGYPIGACDDLRRVVHVGKSTEL